MLTVEDEQFLRGVEVIRYRSLITVAAVALVSVVFVAFLAGCTVGALHPPITGGLDLAVLGDRLSRLTMLLRASLLFFLSTVVAIIVGVVVLIASYARQTKRMLAIIERLRAAHPTGGV